MKSKWFEFTGCCFMSKKKARSLKEAWDKTLEKWGLKMCKFSDSGKTCGLCDKYDENCLECPLHQTQYGVLTSGKRSCLPFYYDPDLEYLFLLFVKEATYKGRTK